MTGRWSFRHLELFWRFAVIAVALGATAILLTVWVLETPGWTTTTVKLPRYGVENCYFINSTKNADRFCLNATSESAGFVLHGTFDHGPGTSASPFALGGGGPCLTCTTVIWTSPDGTGRLWWPVETDATGLNGTIGALN